MLFYIVDGYLYLYNRDKDIAYPAELKDGFVNVDRKSPMPKHKNVDSVYTLSEILSFENTDFLVKSKPKKSK